MNLENNQSPSPKKRLGQHFLIAEHIALKIAEAIPAKTTETVLEIGPGKGALSKHIEKRFPNFHCVEIDEEVLPDLCKTLSGNAWTLHKCDAKQFDVKTVGESVHVAGNLPYNAAAYILKNICLQAKHVRSITFMVQREVAERIVSGPHSKKNGFLTIFCHFFGVPKILFHVPPAAFFPRPNVESSVFTMNLFPIESCDIPANLWESFFSLVDKGFRMRRKTLLNNLVATTPSFTKDSLMQVIANAGISATARPEDLCVADWKSLFRTLEEKTA